MKGSYEFAWREGGWNLIWLEAIASGLKKGLFVYKDGMTIAYFSKKQFKSDSREAFEFYANKAKRKKKLKEIDAIFKKELKDWQKKLSPEKLKKLNSLELNQAFNRFVNSTIKLAYNYNFTEPWRTKELEEVVLSRLKEIGQEALLFELLKEPKKALKLKLKPKETDLIQALHDVGKAHWQVRSQFDQADYSKGMNHLIKEIARRKYKAINQIEACRIKEVNNLLLKNIFPQAANKRTDYFVVLGSKKGSQVFSGQKARQMEKELLAKQSPLDQTLVKGMTANPGQAKGRVRVIYWQKGFEEKVNAMKEGDILVSSETTPELMPAIKKAAAIVTEMGGLTSHASIISRELDKPCIVGTKIATQVFKDGDLVEVNATKGTVKRIK